MNVMKKKSILIFSSFVLIWGALFFYGYERYQELHNDRAEIIALNKQLKDSRGETLLKSSSYDLFTDPVEQIDKNNFFRGIANAEEDKNFISKEFYQELSRNNMPDNKDYLYKMCGNFRCYTGEQFVDLYNKLEQGFNLEKSDKQIFNKEIDSYIASLAKKRGYRERVIANDDSIIDYLTMKTRPEVRDAYIKMRDEMKKEGISLHFVSGYRSVDRQRNIFLRKLDGIDTDKILSGVYDEKIDKVLEKSAFPGYSKHHSGHAIDFGCGNNYLVYSFANTECYKWMSENNFENTKRFGFIPSYPEGVSNQGPDPEPWEFVWVGVDNIK